LISQNLTAAFVVVFVLVVAVAAAEFVRQQPKTNSFHTVVVQQKKVDRVGGFEPAAAANFS
jgi:hypothetical protein